ncbi:MAG: T9SS type A sorting domain-containing protein [Bacteroidia bacterium]
MKIVSIVVLLSCSSYGQINPFKGIYTLDSCQFESSCKMVYYTDTVNTLWQIGKPQKPFFGVPYSGHFALITDTVKPYPNSIHTYFDVILPRFYPNLIIGFKHKFETDLHKDGGYIEVSYDSGHTWNNVIDEEKVHKPKYFAMEGMYSQNDSLTDNHKGFSGTSSVFYADIRIQWVWLIPLSGSLPRPLYLRFNFISDSVGSEKSGWIIDDLYFYEADMGTSIKRIKRNTNLKYSPNPMTTETVFSFDNSLKEKYTLQLFNSTGQVVKTQSEYHPQSITLKKDNLNGGLYYFLLKSESGFQAIGNLMIK